MNSYEFFKLDRPMTRMEAHQLIAGAIMSFAEEDRPIQPSALVHAEACAVQIGIAPVNREQFRKTTFDTFPEFANDFVNRLIQIGVLERNWVLGGNLFKLNPERKETLRLLTTLEGLATTEFVETLHDDVLRAHCEAMVINTGSPDTLIREAATVLEDRLRRLVEGPVDRRNLPAKALHHRTGTNRNLFAEPAMQEDFFHLVRGVLGLYGTPAHHGIQEDLLPQTATRVVAIIDEILETLPH